LFEITVLCLLDRTYAVGAAVALPPPQLPQYNCGSNMQLRKSCWILVLVTVFVQPVAN